MDRRHERYEALRAQREVVVVEAAIAVARELGYTKTFRRHVAAHAKVANGSVSCVFGTMQAMRDRIMEEAVKRRIPELIAQGLADRHQTALNAPPELRRQALDLLR